MRMTFNPDHFEDAEFVLPEGYVIASITEYPERKGLHGCELDYCVSVQLVNAAYGLCQRGTGETLVEAVERAIAAVAKRGF